MVYISWKIYTTSQEILSQLIPLLFQYLTQVVSHLPGVVDR